MKREMKKMYHDLEFENPKTLSAALSFAARCGLGMNEDCDVSMEHCLIFAMKLYEESCYDLEDPEDLDDALDGDLDAFDIDHYRESEFQIFQAMGYCLYDFTHRCVGDMEKKGGRREKKKKGKKKR